jgi:hypothetical protein
MADRISNYRQVRLIINPARFDGSPASWSLTAIVVKKGIPHATSLAGGRVTSLGYDCSEEEFWAALAWIVNRNYRSPSE